MSRAAKTLAASFLAVAIAGCGGGGSSSGNSGVGQTGGKTSTGGSTGGGLGSTGSTTGGVGTISSGTTFAFVSRRAGNSITSYDVGTGSSAGAMSASGGPGGLSVDGAKEVLVAESTGRRAVAFDSTSYAQLASIDLANAPLSQYPALAPLDAQIRSGYAPMSVVEAAPGKFYVPAMCSVTVIQNGAAVKGIMDLDVTGRNPSNLNDLLAAPMRGLGACRAAAANGKVFVTNFLSDSVTVIDASTDSVVANVAVGKGPVGIAVDKLGTAHVACVLSGEVFAINTSTNALGQTIAGAGVGPIDVACDQQTGMVYVSNAFSGDVAKIDGAAGQVVDRLTVSSHASLSATQSGLNQALTLVPWVQNPTLGSALAGSSTSSGGTGSSGGSGGGIQSLISMIMGLLGGGGGGSGSSSGGSAQGMQQIISLIMGLLGGGSSGGGSSSGGSAQGMQQIISMIMSLLGGGGSGTTGTGGSGGTGTTTGSGLGAFIQAALGASSGGTISGLVQQLLGTFSTSATTQLGGSGIWGLGLSSNGAALVVANAATGEVSFVDTVSKAFAVQAGAAHAAETGVVVVTR